MAYLKNFSGQNLLRIEGGRIKEYSSGMTKYVLNGNRLTDFAGRTLCTFDGERIKDFGGRTLLTVSTDTVRNFSCQTIARFDTNSIKNFSGQAQYRIDGFYPALQDDGIDCNCLCNLALVYRKVKEKGRVTASLLGILIK